MSLNWPWWVILPMLAVVYWPATVVLTVISAGGAVLTRGIARVVAAVLALVFCALLLTAGYLALSGARRDREAQAFAMGTREKLVRPRVIDGLPLPAETDVKWTALDKGHLRMAGFPTPTLLMGVSVTWVQRSDDGADWDMQLSTPQTIEGWPCDTVGVRLSPAGRLRGCHLHAHRRWSGWPIPADTFLDLTQDGAVKMTFTGGGPIAAPEIGRSIPAQGGVVFNADGSLAQAYFDQTDPLVMHGVKLWNVVNWVYDPQSLGQGRHRHALAVRGVTLPDAVERGGILPNQNVDVRPSDGRVRPVD